VIHRGGAERRRETRCGKAKGKQESKWTHGRYPT
jgi:hypothetical protein